MSQFDRVQPRPRRGGNAAYLLVGAVTACVPERALRGRAEAPGGEWVDSTRGVDASTGARCLERDARLPLDGPTSLAEDALMERPDFTLEATSELAEVHAGGRAVIVLHLMRAGGHRAWIEHRVSGLPANVTGFFATGPDADQLALVIEASDQAALVTHQPFTLEANGDGLRRTRRMLLTVLPEKAPEE